MFNSLKNFPKKYLNDFVEEEIRRIKSRSRFGVWVFLPLYIVGSAIGNFLILGTIALQLVYTWIFLICVCLAVLYLIKKVSTLFLARATAILFITVILSSIIRFQIVQAFPPFHAAVTCIILLFGSTFIIPWSPVDIVSLGVIHAGVYCIYSLQVSRYVYKNVLFSSDARDFFQGIIVITVVAIICFLVNRRDYRRRVRNFLLIKEIAEKNNQMHRELELATRVHNRILPHSESTPLADVAVTYLPMYYIGGDYAKFHLIDDNKLIFIICDVTGHGVSAALLVNAFNAEFERMAKKKRGPGVLLKDLDTFISEDFGETNMYLSAFCGLLDYNSMKFYYSNYGHPPQYIYRSAHSEIELVKAQTTLLGLHAEDETVYQSEISFNRGDQILLFTDGIVEARNLAGEMYGSGRLETFIRENQTTEVDAFNKKLMDELNSFSAGTFEDDVFILNILIK